MDLLNALRDVREGRKITRKILENEPDTYVELQAGQLMIHRQDDKLFHPWIISEVDLHSSDWFVLNPRLARATPTPPMVPFAEGFEEDPSSFGEDPSEKRDN